MLDNVDALDEEDLRSDPEDNREWLLLLLLGKFNFEKKFKSIFTNMLTKYSNESFNQAVKEIKQLGEFNITADQRKEIINNIIADRVAFLLPEIERATKNMIGASVSTAGDKDTLKQAIKETYAVSNERVATIEGVEFVTIRNATRIATAELSDIIAGVLVSDGDGCAICPTIDGQVWSLDYASGNLLQHPHCVRSFTFLTADEVEEYGGLDEE